MKAILVFLIVFCSASIVTGVEVYRWVDDEGVTHFTDDPGAVPEGYRSDAERLEMPGETPEAEPEVFSGEILEEEDEGILVEDDLKEKDEEWWRNRAEKWRTRLQEAYDKYEKLRLAYNAMATEFNVSQDPEQRKELKAELDGMQTEMEKHKADIEKARRMQEEVLPSQVEKAGKPLEWVR